MQKVTRQTINDIYKLLYAYDHFTEFEGEPIVWVSIKALLLSLAASTVLCAPTWLADRNRNPFSWRIDWNVFIWLNIAFFIGFFVIVLIKSPTDKYVKYDYAFRRHCAMKKAFSRLPRGRRNDIAELITTLGDDTLLETITTKQYNALKTVVAWYNQKG